MAGRSLKKTIRTVRKSMPSRKAMVSATRQTGARLKKAAISLEKAAANYARQAKAAGVTAGKTAKKVSKTRSAQVLAAAALAAAGYVAVRKARKR